jgi:tRNA A37 threonylcarbamoyladenosine dehydratase
LDQDYWRSWVLLLQVALLAACKRRGVKVLCSAGAGAKADPTRLRIVDVSESSIDPLARSVRHK